MRCAFDAGAGACPPPPPPAKQVLAAALEACCDLDAQAAMRVCSAFCSDWFMAHAPPLLAAHPAGGAPGWPASCSGAYPACRSPVA